MAYLGMQFPDGGEIRGAWFGIHINDESAVERIGTMGTLLHSNPCTPAKSLAGRKILRFLDVINGIVGLVQFGAIQVGRVTNFSGLKYCWPAAALYIPMGIKNIYQACRRIRRDNNICDKEGFRLSLASIPANISFIANALATSLVGLRLIFDSVRPYTSWAPPIAALTAFTSPIYMILDILGLRRSNQLENKIKNMSDEEVTLYIKNSLNHKHIDNAKRIKELSESFVKKGVFRLVADYRAKKLVIRERRKWLMRRTNVKITKEKARSIVKGSKDEDKKLISIIRDRTHRKILGHKLSILATIVTVVAVAILFLNPIALFGFLSVSAMLLSTSAVIFIAKSLYETGVIFKNKDDYQTSTS